MPLGVPSFPWGDMFSSHGKYPNWIIVAKNILEHLQCQRVSSVTVRHFRNPYLPRPSKIGGTHMYILHWLELIQWSTRPINWNKTKRNDKTAWNEQETSNGGSPRNLVEHTINQWTAERTRAKHTRLDNLYGMWVAFLLSRTRSWPWCKTWRNRQVNSADLASNLSKEPKSPLAVNSDFNGSARSRRAEPIFLASQSAELSKYSRVWLLLILLIATALPACPVADKQSHQIYWPIFWDSGKHRNW